MNKYTLTAFLIIAALCGFTPASYAQGNIVDKVISVVNEDVITLRDLEDRTAFMARQIGKKLPAQQYKKLHAKTLGQLINEKVQQQYAEQIGITATKQEVNLAIATIERNNNLSVGAFYKLAHGLETTAREKIRVELLWQKVVERRVRPRVMVSNNELDQLIEQLINSNTIVEKELHQIFLSFSDDNRNTQIAHGLELSNTLRDNANKFSQTAKAVSEGANAVDGGYLGWYGNGELAAQLDDILKTMKKGDVSAPIHTANGLHILYVKNMRETKSFSTAPLTDYRLIRLAQAIPEKEGSAIATAFKKEVSAIKRLSDVEEFMEKYKDNKAYVATKDMGWIEESQLPSQYAAKLKKMQTNKRTAFVSSEKSIETIYLASKRVRIPEQLKIYRERIKGRLFQSRIELAARRFIRDLKRRAYIDVRL